MLNVTFSLLLVALALNAENAFGTNQHLICKTVDDVFTDGTLGQADIRPQTIQGPPGKRGQTGVKGEHGVPGLNGEQGLPGLVDSQDIVNAVKEEMREVTRDFQERIETLEGKVLEHASTIQELLFWCGGGGFYYKTKCYNVILHASYDVNYAKSSELCTQKGGRPADILNAEHQSLVADYVRKKTSRHVDIYLGMTYKTGTLRFSNGNDVTGDVSASFSWWSRFPISDSSRESVEIVVTPTAYGFANFPPTSALTGVLCEK